MNRSIKLIGMLVLGLWIAVPAAHASRPDDKAEARGPGAIAAAQQVHWQHPQRGPCDRKSLALGPR